ncbi:MAG: prolyl oligopeptidase family serine peptidase [Bauldia sp.]|nr:prolyl oligopeptidase family serine peptidase [Bauldia sp.]
MQGDLVSSLGHDFAHDSAALGRRKLVRVLAPPQGCDATTSCLILLHPFAGNRTSWLRHAPDLLTSISSDTLLAMPECGRRWFIDDHAGTHYESYIVEDLLPALANEYGVSGPVAVGGFSAGGAAAFFLALRHPDLFNAALAVAGAFTAGNRTGDPYRDVRTDDMMIPSEEEHDRVWGPPGSTTRALYDPGTLVAARLQGSQPRFLFDVGEDDFPRMIAASERMAGLLKDAGLPFAYSRSPGDHTWGYAVRAMARLVTSWRNGS